MAQKLLKLDDLLKRTLKDTIEHDNTSKTLRLIYRPLQVFSGKQNFPPIYIGILKLTISVSSTCSNTPTGVMQS